MQSLKKQDKEFEKPTLPKLATDFDIERSEQRLRSEIKETEHKLDRKITILDGKVTALDGKVDLIQKTIESSRSDFRMLFGVLITLMAVMCGGFVTVLIKVFAAG